MKRIKQLSKHLINQIAAGEVIERPVSVVKELVENSIDAGATKINIDVSNECRDIRIADNGSGIHPDDILLAFSKHATSKISESEDLFNIHTLGFRGEALSSIISISKLICITRTKDFETGIKVECENSEVKSVKTGCAVGTIMEIKDLFYNIPARLKFLKSAKTELSYIQEYIQTVAIIHPNIAFQLKNNDKMIIETNGLNDFLQTVGEISSKEVINFLRPVNKTDELSGLKVSGYVSTPDYTRSSKKSFFTYVNSRPVKCYVIQKAIDMAYKNLIDKTKYPFVILNVQVSPDDVDVNVHPTKKEVRYKNTNQIFSFIVASIKMALNNQIEAALEENFETELIQQVFSVKKEEIENTDDVYISDKPIFSKPKIVDSNLKKADFQLKMNIPNPPIKQTYEYVEPDQDENIIGQYKKTYILIEKEDGLEIIDQHIADERYIYEKLKSQKNVASQILFVSDILTVSPSEAELIKENLDKFQKFGFGIEFLKENELMFKKIPQLISRVNPKDILSDILENIRGNLDGLEERILITASCKAAIKAGESLTMYQMQTLIKNWRKCEEPYTCPHGRPISKLLKHKEIAGFFDRNK